MSEYQPGTVATATVRGVKGVRVMRTSGKAGADVIWATAEFFDGTRGHLVQEVTDVRPLVVLDLDGKDAGRLVVVLRGIDKWDSDPDCRFAGRVADQIEAQTQPARIPEPGLWGVVEASTYSLSKRQPWVRHEGGSTCWRDPFGNGAVWGVLIDPVLVREGLS